MLLSGVGRAHLEGHKELSNTKPVIEMEVPDTVWIPLVDGAATDFEVLVQPGDHVEIGTMIARRKGMDVPLYASVSGEVKGQVKKMHPTRRQQNHIEIINDHKDTSVKVLDIEDPEAMSPEDIVNAIRTLGVVGMGGSGFPTYIKYSNVKNIETIIINGVECEPYITSDYMTMMTHARDLFDGAAFFMKAAGAPEAKIAIKTGHPELYDILLEEAKNHDNITPVLVPDVYPMGWERTLVKEITGRDYDRLPAEAGCVVSNAMSAIALSQGIRTGMPVTERIVTVSGDGVKNPCNVKVRVGTPANLVIEASGGYIDDDVEGHVIAGGPMMGKSISRDDFVISEYMNALTVLKHKEEHVTACMRCGECVLHCPMNLQPVRIMNAEQWGDAELLEKLAVMRCVECGMCSYICPSKIEVTDFVQKGKRRVTLAQKRRAAK